MTKPHNKISDAVSLVSKMSRIYISDAYQDGNRYEFSSCYQDLKNLLTICAVDNEDEFLTKVKALNILVEFDDKMKFLDETRLENDYLGLENLNDSLESTYSRRLIYDLAQLLEN